MKSLFYVLLFFSTHLFAQTEAKKNTRVEHVYQYNDWAGAYRYLNSKEEFYREDGKKELEITFLSDSIIKKEEELYGSHYQSANFIFKITQFNYDEFNVLIETKTLNPNFHYSLLTKLTEKPLPTHLKEIEVLNFNNKKEGIKEGNPKKRIVHTFDNDHRQIEERRYLEGQKEVCYESEYQVKRKDSLNYRVEEVTYLCGESTVVREGEKKYENGLLVKEISQNLNLSLSHVFTYEYGKHNRLEKETSFVYKGLNKNVEINKISGSEIIKTVFSYSEDNRLIKKENQKEQIIYHYY